VAFGQQSGPPASSHQVRELLALLHDAGHVDFRDARGPMGFTQRQAAGKFTGPEAAAFIDALTNELSPPPTAVTESTATVVPEPVPAAPDRPSQRTLRRLPTEDLATELRRRGWHVISPPDSPENERR
jgi:hypothetical protein